MYNHSLKNSSIKKKNLQRNYLDVRKVFLHPYLTCQGREQIFLPAAAKTRAKDSKELGIEK